MIHIDFFVAIATYLTFIILLVIGRWIFYNYSDEASMTIESKHLEQCPYCTYIFFDYTQAPLKVCPRCESYIALDELKKAE